MDFKNRSNQFSFYRNVLWQIILLGAKYILPLIILPYLTRVLGPDEYSLYAYVLSIMSFCAVFLDYGFTYYGAQRYIKNTEHRGKIKVVSTIQETKFLLTILGGIAVILFCANNGITENNILFVFIFYISTAIKAFSPDFVFQACENLSIITIRFVIIKSLTVFVTILIVDSHEKILYIPVLDLIGNVCSCVYSFYLLKKKYNISFSYNRFSMCKTYLRQSFLYCFTNFMAIIYNGFTTILIGMAYFNKDYVAYWSIATTLIYAIQSLSGPVINSLYPYMLNNKNKKFLLSISKIMFPIYVVASVLLYFVADYIVISFAGNEYGKAVDVFKCLIPVVILSFYSMLYGWPCLGVWGEIKAITVTTVSSAMFSVIALLILLSFNKFNIENICIVRCISEALLCFSRMVFSFKYVIYERK